MNSNYLLGLIFATGAVWAADATHPLEVRPGMWENTMTIQMSGTPPIPPEVLAKLTPEQKAMMEARMKSRNGAPVTSKRCLTKQDLDKPLDFGHNDSKCKRSIISSSSAKQEFGIACETAGMKTNGTVRIEALDAEHVKVTSHITSGDGGRTMTIDANGTGKWLSATCTAGEK